MVRVEIQEQLAEALLQAQTALKEFGEGKNDDDVTIDDFEEMIVDELNEEGIPVSDERIVAVAEWVPICIEDNGIYIVTAIIECVESSIDELMNDFQKRYELEEIIMTTTTKTKIFHDDFLDETLVLSPEEIVNYGIYVIEDELLPEAYDEELEYYHEELTLLENKNISLSERLECAISTLESVSIYEQQLRRKKNFRRKLS